MSPTSERKKSQQKDSLPITLADRLMILQQAIHDYQEAGGQIEIVVLHGKSKKIAIVLYGINQDLHGNLVLHGNSEIAMQKV